MAEEITPLGTPLTAPEGTGLRSVEYRDGSVASSTRDAWAARATAR
jgi:hypothetical protein